MDNLSTNNKHLNNNCQAVFYNLKIEHNRFIINSMEKFIIDANLFFNMEAGVRLGNKTDQVIKQIVNYSKKLKKKAEFIMPPSAVNEFLSFFKNKNQPLIKDLLSVVVVRSPNKNQLNFSAMVFYQLVDEIRKRSYRGLNLGEEEIKKAGRLMLGKNELSKKEFEIKIGAVIKNFRNRYRLATRTGFLDSVADLDLIVLAKEVDGFLVSADDGVIYWGRVFGVKEVILPAFRQRLESLVGHQE